MIVGVAALVWLVFLRDGGEEAEDPPASVPVSTETALAIAEMTPPELADQVLLVGFAGADGSRRFVDELRRTSSGA